jgi:hypothetical protein
LLLTSLTSAMTKALAGPPVLRPERAFAAGHEQRGVRLVDLFRDDQL